MKTKEKHMAETATGCVQQGTLVYYAEGGKKVTLEEAISLMQECQEVHTPAAGAGSYREVFNTLGFQEVEVIDWASSAGDWIFGVKNDKGWFVGFQENRYPYHGFCYSISDLIYPCESMEELTERMEEI